MKNIAGNLNNEQVKELSFTEAMEIALQGVDREALKANMLAALKRKDWFAGNWPNFDNFGIFTGNMFYLIFRPGENSMNSPAINAIRASKAARAAKDAGKAPVNEV